MSDGYYQCSVSVGAKGGGAAHARYVGRTGEFEHRSKTEKLEAVVEGNLPAWARTADYFFQQADKYEREKGTTYRDVEFALPRQLNPEQRLALANDFRERLLGDRHAFIMGLHTPVSQFDGQEQPHAHLAFSERMNDGVARDPDEYFKRYNAKNPEKGGCKKLAGGSKEALDETRKLWEEVANEHLERAGLDVRLDRRSLKERGIIRTVPPEQHWGPGFVAKLTPDEKAEIQRKRDLQKEVDQIQLRENAQPWDLAAELAEVTRRAEILTRPERKLPGFGKMPTQQEMAAEIREMREQHEKKQREKAAQAEKEKQAEIEAKANAMPDRHAENEKAQEKKSEQITAASPGTPPLEKTRTVTAEELEKEPISEADQAAAQKTMDVHLDDYEQQQEQEQGLAPGM